MDSDYDDDFFDEALEEEEIEESAGRGRKLNWRRIEKMKERLWLKKQLEDFDNYAD